MSLSPGAEFPSDEALAAPAPVRKTWQGRLLGICFAIFAFEIGLFLVIFPWMDESWDINLFSTLLPAMRTIWNDPYFRGAVTGLGLVNIYIAFLEVVRQFRRP